MKPCEGFTVHEISNPLSPLDKGSVVPQVPTYLTLNLHLCQILSNCRLAYGQIKLRFGSGKGGNPARLVPVTVFALHEVKWDGFVYT